MEIEFYMIYYRDGTIWQRYWSSRPTQIERSLHALKREHGIIPTMLLPELPGIALATQYSDEAMTKQIEVLYNHIKSK